MIHDSSDLFVLAKATSYSQKVVCVYGPYQIVFVIWQQESTHIHTSRMRSSNQESISGKTSLPPIYTVSPSPQVIFRHGNQSSGVQCYQALCVYVFIEIWQGTAKTLAKTAWAVVPVRKIRVTGLAISRLLWDFRNRECSKGLERNDLGKEYFVVEKLSHSSSSLG